MDCHKFKGIAIFVAGAFLLTPGFLTDTLGCILLIPKTRNIIIKYITSYLEKKTIHKKKSMYEKNEEDKEIIEDLIISAVNKGISKAQSESKEKMNSVTGGMLSGLNIPGM